MVSSARRRAFTLIEAMIVVVLVGVLAIVADLAYRRWVHSAYLSEAQDMVANIRSAEETFRAENGAYLNVTGDLGPQHDYPLATPGKFKTAWGADCTVCANSNTRAWAQLNIQPSAPVAFGYSLMAGIAPGDAFPTTKTKVNGNPIVNTALPPGPWYVVEADGDIDGNGVFTKVFGLWAADQLFIENEGE